MPHRNGEKRCWPDIRFRERADWYASYRSQFHNDNSYLEIQSDPLRRVKDLRFIQLPLPSDLQGRVVALSNGLRPYRFLVEDSRKPINEEKRGLVSEFLNADVSGSSPVLSNKPLSIERGILLDVLTQNNIEIGSGLIWAADFRSSLFRDRDVLRKNLSVLRLAE